MLDTLSLFSVIDMFLYVIRYHPNFIVSFLCFVCDKMHEIATAWLQNGGRADCRSV
jgi:hypothetical protein